MVIPEKVKSAGIYTMAIMIICTMFITSYIGFSIFFYSSLLCLITPLTTGMSHITYSTNAAVELIQLVSWCIYALPLISFLLSINYQLFSRFFQNYTGIFDIAKVVKYIEYQFGKESSPRKTLILIGMVLESFVCVCIVLMIFTGNVTGLGWCSFVVGFISLIAPVESFVIVPFVAWKVMINAILGREEQIEISEPSLEDLEEQVPMTKEEKKKQKEKREKEKKRERERHHITVMDPFQIRKQEEWIGFLKSRANIFIGIRKGIEKPKLIVGIVFISITLAYIVIDIVVSSIRINKALTTTFTEEVSMFTNALDALKLRLINQDYKPGDTKAIINSVKHFAQSLMSKPSHLIIGTLIRIFVDIYLFPMVISGNIASIFMYWKKIEEQSLVRVCHVIATVLMTVYFIIFILWGGVFMNTYDWNPFKQGYKTIEPLYNSVTDKSQKLMCSQKIENWEYLELVAMPMLAQMKRTDVKAHDTFVKEIFSNTKDSIYSQGGGDVNAFFGEAMNFDINNMSIPTIAYLKDSIAEDGITVVSESMVYGFGGVTEPSQLAFMLENVVKYWFDIAMTALIPFLSIVRGIAMDKFLDNIPKIVDELFFGFETKTEEQMRKEMFWLAAMYDAEKYMFKSFDMIGGEMGTVVVGHSSGGLFAKAFAAKKQLSVMALESPVFEHSKAYDLIVGSVSFTDEIDIGWDKMMNIYSTGSLYCADEDNATSNWKYPSLKGSLFGWVVPINAYETFCFHAAACISDDRYDGFCSWAVGHETYEKYFQSWKRPREPVNKRYYESVPDK